MVRIFRNSDPPVGMNDDGFVVGQYSHTRHDDPGQKIT